MEESDNITELMRNATDSAGLNVTAPVRRTAAASVPTMNPVVGLVVSVTGSTANTVVLTVLVLARRRFGSNVNTFIINQTVIDLLSCVSLVAISWLETSHCHLPQSAIRVDNSYGLIRSTGLIYNF